MEDYKKKYEEALNSIRESFDYNNLPYSGIKEKLEKAFPELKEGEDERIRKEIIQSIQDNMCVIHKDKCIAWLEKQGEQKSNDKVEPKFKVGDTIRPKGSMAEYTIESISGECYHGKGWGLHISYDDDYELVEQKPTWSEEDEHCIELLLPIIDSSSLIPKNRKKCKKFLKSLKERVQPQPNQEWSEEEKARINKIIDVLDWAEEKGRISYSDWEDYVCYVKSLKPQSNQKSAWSEEDKKKIDLLIAIFEINHPNGQFKANPINTLNMEYVSTEEIIDWLKSLKEKYAWKPSEEQMKALNYVINLMASSESPTENDYYYNVFKDLRTHLKKLREE